GINVLPPGMTLRSDGTLSGTPTLALPFYFTVVVTDQNGARATRQLVLQVLPDNSPLQLSLSIASVSDGSNRIDPRISATYFKDPSNPDKPILMSKARGGRAKITVTALLGGAPAQDLPVTLTFTGIPKSGGHEHMTADDIANKLLPDYEDRIV